MTESKTAAAKALELIQPVKITLYGTDNDNEINITDNYSIKLKVTHKCVGSLGKRRSGFNFLSWAHSIDTKRVRKCSKKQHQDLRIKDLADFAVCGCECKAGHLKKDLEWNPQTLTISSGVSNSNSGSKNEEAVKKTCCLPSGCLHVEDASLLPEHVVVKVVCTNKVCRMSQFMHVDCFKQWEEKIGVEKHEKTASKSSTNLLFGLMFFMILLALAAECISSSFESVEVVNKSETPHTLQLYQNNLVGIKGQFPSQDDRLWKIIRIALEPHLTSTGQPKPAVLLLASDEESTPTAECLAQKLSSAFSSSCEVKDAKVYGSNLNPGTAKMDLDKLITSKFKKGACSVVVSRIELIPTHAITVFYQFCEDDNAPFKEAAILLTLQVDFGEWGRKYKKLSRLPPKLWDSVVSDYLTYSLQSRDPDFMTENMIGGLLSRITPSVVWVNKEEKMAC